ncbi:hypothetical protein TUM3794_20310 [Shewanella colwelliana]|uniref:Uncharacterized protein n=1 Tax=Shewanella colwelliana TaxID=23 RepID=A0ABQ4P0I0_SHECO|nr:hypothetical protein [Shewanella colwelliana]GIU40993.1 hypothetical protein TUM3794_20310 [Shewanella colwelliana]
MLNQLTQLKTLCGAERLNFSINFLADNKARVVLTTQVAASATGNLAELVKRPIVLTGSLSDIDMLLTNELLNLADDVTNIQDTPSTTTTQDAPASESAPQGGFSDDVAETVDEVNLDEEESL